jgi:beta-mannosidase
MLRVWGGGIVNKEAFYELCDQKGLLVWQEFPLACNNYLSTPEYLAVLEQESESIILKLRDHPSIAIWSGGSELFNACGSMTNQSLALRLLSSQCLRLDPQTPYIHTSPLEGMAHGPWLFRDPETGLEVFQQMAGAGFTAYTEFGVPSPAPVEVLEKIIPEKELWPPQPGTSWESHHAFNAHGENGWLMQGTIEDYFGPSESLDELVSRGQLLQSEGYKAIYEEARRQKPYSSMALGRSFNEPWPTAANSSIISWPNIPKPAYEAVSNACRPVLASARIEKFTWREGELFETDLYILNDSFETIRQGSMVIKLVAGSRELTLMHWDYDPVEPNKNLQGPTVRTVLPKWEVDRFMLQLEVFGQPEFNSEYLLLYEATE